MSYISIHPVKPKKSQRTPAHLFDKIVMIVSVLYPLSALPQAFAVLSGHAEGVSVLSWGFFLVSAVLFLIYGIKRSVPPMIISNSIWVITDSLVVIGLLSHGIQTVI